MRITYTGIKKSFTDMQQKKIDVRAAKLAKLVERKGEKTAQITLTNTRHIFKAEIRMNYHDHPVAAVGEGTDEGQAVLECVSRAEKQVLKLRDKWNNGKRGSVAKKVKDGALAGVMAEAVENETDGAPAVKVFRARNTSRKPMTLDEAMMEMSSDARNYLVFRDAESDVVSILVRRKDGHYDLIEA